MSGYDGVWREPAEESLDLYPGLVVHDGRVNGSITAGRSRLPLWCFVSTAVRDGWDDVEHSWEPSRHGMTGEMFGEFLYDLLELRGEFGRLLLVLADAERREGELRGRWLSERDDGSGIVAIPLDENADRPLSWWDYPLIVENVRAQLHRCLEALGGQA